VEGFGPFGASYGPLHAEYPEDHPNGGFWFKTYLSVKEIPKTWSRITKTMVWLDGRQLAYQNYKAGNIDEEGLADLKKSWDWEPDPTKLPDRSIKCYVYVIRGRDAKGKAAVMVDTNNNLDFSDETPFYPEVGNKSDWNTMRTYDPKLVQYVSYEVFEEGRVVTKRVPMVVKRMPSEPAGQQFWYCMPQYAQVKLRIKGKEHTVAIHSGFSGTNYESPDLVLVDSTTTKRYNYGEGVAKGEILSVGSFPNTVSYRNKGVDLYHNALVLEGEEADLDEYSLQAGFRFKPFEATEFRTGKPIRLADYQGKYVFIDFWGTWCPGCVEELPRLLEMYQGIDRSQIEFIGIAGQQSPPQLAKFLKKRPLPWPQVVSDSSNLLVETYNISAYPTNVLVGPDGRVVAKNLHCLALKKKLAEITNK
jgi:thiol-disulfide isomerase/thioredoxin